ncbi:hypothetical protein DFH29DRAFT_871741 [Suillus ampliporus]|nr:hypothetical protein DFH29DRAFT_871741 [Suillus ampliporus]
MDINNSTVSGNIQAVTKLLAQGGILDPTDAEIDTPEISQYVVLIHGNLGTGKRLQTVQLQQSIEATPWDYLQHVIYIPGLFHLKMACFQWMHQLIGSAGTCRWLDCWGVHVKSKNASHGSLEAFAASEPTLNDLKVLADELAQRYIANHTLQRLRRWPAKERDLQYKNTLFMNKLFLLYEELSYAMN